MHYGKCIAVKNNLSEGINIPVDRVEVDKEAHKGAFQHAYRIDDCGSVHKCCGENAPQMDDIAEKDS